MITLARLFVYYVTGDVVPFRECVKYAAAGLALFTSVYAVIILMAVVMAR